MDGNGNVNDRKTDKTDKTNNDNDNDSSSNNINNDEDSVLVQKRRLWTEQTTPITLHKMSLRIRLEAYYRLVCPDQLVPRGEWLHRFDQIYNKYGGSVDGERTLATKLMKKYGKIVQLKVATTPTSSSNSRTNPTGLRSQQQQKQQNSAGTRTRVDDDSNNNNGSEQSPWYELDPIQLQNYQQQQASSGDVRFVSQEFDPYSALILVQDETNVWKQQQQQQQQQVGGDINDCNDTAQQEEDNAATSVILSSNVPIFDNVDKCAILLPDGDPLQRKQQQQQYHGTLTRNHHHQQQHRRGQGGGKQSVSSSSSKPKPLHPFDEISFALGGPESRRSSMLGIGDGPMSVLFRLQQQQSNSSSENSSSHHHHNDRTDQNMKKKQKQVLTTVVIRYVNAIRGTITGTLIAYDKHMNMILRNVVEVYNPRPITRKSCDNMSELALVEEEDESTKMMIDSVTDNNMRGNGNMGDVDVHQQLQQPQPQQSQSNVEIEVARRKRLRRSTTEMEHNEYDKMDDSHTATKNSSNNTNNINDTNNVAETDERLSLSLPRSSPTSSSSSSWNVRRRFMKQLFVRGDMVVSVYKATELDGTMSTIPQPRYTRSRYYNSSKKK